MPEPFISIIIPTFEDWDDLNVCLKGLRKQSYAHEKFEVIIVNNSPKSNGYIPNLYLNERVIQELTPGSYAARNAGLKEAKGSLIAFTDTDCIPEKMWLEKLVESHVSQETERVGGKIQLFFKSNKLTCVEIYEKAFAFRQEENVGNGVAVTANLLVDKRLFDVIGLFDERLMSGGDFEWNLRATHYGAKIVYSEHAIIHHPARRDMRQLLKKTKRTALGGGILKRKPIILLLGLFVPPVSAARILIRHDMLTLREKVVAYLVAYFLKFYRTYIILKYKIENEPAAKL